MLSTTVKQARENFRNGQGPPYPYSTWEGFFLMILVELAERSEEHTHVLDTEDAHSTTNPFNI